MKKILFISHDASRTGAPIVLLNTIKWFRTERLDYDIDVLLMKGGELESDFANLATRVFEGKTIHKQFSLYDRIIRKLKVAIGIKVKSPRTLFLNAIAQHEYGLIYANTIIVIPTAVDLKQMMFNECKLLSHIHELNTVIATELPNLSVYDPMIDCYVAASYLVKTGLVNNHGITENKIDVVYEFSTVEEGLLQEDKKDNSFVIGASGSLNWRKGYDVFILVALAIKKNYPQAEIVFEWVGGSLDSKIMEIIKADIHKAGLMDRVSFFGSHKNPEIYYKNFDVFLMPSREDPFPLVCIEVAMLSKPIICFEGATGTAEVLQKGGGYIVPYLDIEAMTNKIMFYYENKDRLAQDGAIVKQLFEGFTPERMCPLIDRHVGRLLELH